MACGYLPTRNGVLQMRSASRLSPEVHLFLQYIINDFFRIEDFFVVVGFAWSIHALPLVTYVDSCTLVHCDNGLNPGFHCYEAEGAALNIRGVTGSAHSRTIQCLKSTKPQAGFDQDMTKFDELSDMPTQGSNARDAPEAEPPQAC
eukprot:2298532-Pyramimonas_sp.AAC.1